MGKIRARASQPNVANVCNQDYMGYEKRKKKKKKRTIVSTDVPAKRCF